MKKIYLILITFACISTLYFFYISLYLQEKTGTDILTEYSAIRSYPIEIHTIGELEAAQSTSVASLIRSDLGKIIYLIPDGASVKTNDKLIGMDPTPFEEGIEDIKGKINEQKMKIKLLKQAAEWETNQVDHEENAAKIEVTAAELEMKKIIDADGPIEHAKLKNNMQKSYTLYDELKNYVDDLLELENAGFLNPIELKQAQKKLAEEEENYLFAKMQHDNFITHIHPIQVKKATITLNRYKNKYEEILKSGAFKIAKATAQYEHAKQELADLQQQMKHAEYQMSLTEIKAPTQGMVVLKEDFRNGQKRKPRIGDTLMKNQTVLDLPNLEQMLVRTKVREIDLYKIKTGTPATIEIDAYPELKFQGHIISIGVLAFSDYIKMSDEKYFSVILQLDGTNTQLRPGMTARVCCHADKVENKVSIPVQAVFEIENTLVCFIKKDHSIITTPIEIGLSNDRWVEVKSGLKENEEVLLSMPPWSAIKREIK